jgi:histidine triad (HIT) family protein
MNKIQNKNKCPFCEIDKNKTRIVWEGKNVFVVLSNPRLMFGHLLIVPKRHIEKLSELKKEEKKELFEATIKFQEKILKFIAKGCDIRQNFRPFQKQDGLKINHLHIHLQPRKFKDELYKRCQIFEKKIFCPLSKKEMDKIFNIFN